MTKRFRFFDDQTYHFQTLRALNDIPYGGADTSEVLETIITSKRGMPTAGIRLGTKLATAFLNSPVAQ